MRTDRGSCPRRKQRRASCRTMLKHSRRAPRCSEGLAHICVIARADAAEHSCRHRGTKPTVAIWLGRRVRGRRRAHALSSEGLLSMKIAQIAPLYEAVPPRLYGGTERVVAQLCDALVDLGHDVTLFASADAQTRAKLVPVRDQAIRLDPAPLKSDLAAHMTMLAEVRDAQGPSSTSSTSTPTCCTSPCSRTWPARTVTTLHGRLDLKDLPAVYRRWPKFPLVSISDDQRAPPAVRQLGRHGLPRHGRRRSTGFSPRPRGLPGLPRPHVAGEGARPGDRHRQARSACR